MGRNLRFWLAAPQAAQFDPSDAPLALGALLLRAARAEAEGLLSPQGMVGAILARRYELTAQEAAEMLEGCARVEAAAPATPEFAHLLHAVLDPAERRAMALCLCESLAAQGLCEPGDTRALALAATVLGISPDELAPTRRAG